MDKGEILYSHPLGHWLSPILCGSDDNANVINPTMISPKMGPIRNRPLETSQYSDACISAMKEAF